MISPRTQRFDEVHDRLDRIDQAVLRLTSALEGVTVPGPLTTDPAPSSSASGLLVDRRIAQAVDETLSSDRLAQTKAAVLLADKHGHLQYLGANSLPSIASEAESIAQQKFRLKLSTLSSRS